MQNTKRRFGVFDIDGTLIRWQLYHVIVQRLAKAGALGDQAYDALKESLMSWKRRENPDAFKAYEKTLIRVYEDALHHLPTEKFDALVREIIEEYKDQTYLYTRNLLKQLKQDGYCLLIVSGSHHELIEEIGRYYGFDDWIGSNYKRKKGLYTGEKVIASSDKRAALESFIKKHNLTLSGSVGVGDTKSDAPMLAMVENPIAFNPDSKLLQEAKMNGWKIVVERKSVVYELLPEEGRYVLSEANF